jgi:hypothetical protein
MKSKKCEICNSEFETYKELSNHINYVHKLKSEQYTIQYLYGGVQPKCPECGDIPRYVSFEYKKYCELHGNISRSKACSIVGKTKKTWNKDKTKETDERIAKQAELQKGEGNQFYGKHHTEASIRKMTSKKKLCEEEVINRINSRSSEFELLSNINDYSNKHQYLIFRCKKCQYEQEKTLMAFERGSKCDKCFPVGSSAWEWEVGEFIESLGVRIDKNNREVFNGKEIDVYIDAQKFGVECNGLYWHSEASPNFTNANSHYIKSDLATQSGIRLLQLFYDEWRDKRTICESIIRNKLHLSENKIGARQCQLLKINGQKEKDFFESTHISGHTQSTVCFALEKNGEIISALSLRKPFQKKYNNLLEIARFSTKSNTSCQGALSRLFSAAKKYAIDHSFDGIMTYVDRRIGDGHGYIAIGMEQVGKTGVDYWYTDNCVRYNRFQYRAQDGKSEKEVALERKVSRIYGAGSLILTYLIQK